MAVVKQLAVLAVIGVLGFTGCGDKNSPTGPSISENSIVGVWDVKNVKWHAVLKSGATSVTADTTIVFIGANTVDFKNNHTYFVTSNDTNFSLPKRLIVHNTTVVDTATGTWSLSGNQLTVVQTIGDTMISTVSPSGSSMTLTTYIDSVMVISGSNVDIKGSSTLSMTRQ